MSVKTAGVGHFQIPTAPAAGVSVVSGASNTLTATAIVLSASTSAIYITGVHVEAAAASAATYKLVQLCIGGAGSETSIGQYLVPLSTGSTVALGFRPIFPPIPVANASRLSVKTADSVGTQTTLVTVEAILQSNVVDDGIAVGTVTTVTNQLTAAAIATGVWQDAVSGDFTTASSIGKALFTGNVVPGGSGGLMISGTNAGTTTLGALTITGATTHTGNVVFSDGVTISAPSTGNRAGLSITGNGTGAAILATGGATGIGFSIVGGGTSGDGIKVTTTSGHGMNLAPVGSSVHGIFATGGNGGTSDGIKAAAGTGGVDIRGNITGNVTGNLSGSAGSVTGAVGSVTGAVASVTGNVGGNVVGSVASVTARVTANTDQLAGQTVTAAAGVTFPTSVASPTNITAGTITTATNLTNAPTVGDFTAAMKTSLNAATPASVTGAVGSVTGNVGGNVVGSVASVTAGVTVTTNNDKTGYALTAGYDLAKTAAQAGDAMTLTAAYNAAKTASQAGDAMALTGAERTTLAGVVNTTAIVESYRANGAVPTPAQFMSEVLAHLGEASIVGTTKTINKLDHATAAQTFTLDSATTPSTITRAT